MTFDLEGPLLEGSLVRLEPLGRHHASGLAAAAEENRDSYSFTRVPTAARAGAYIDTQLARAEAGSLAPYAQVLVETGRVVGATAYLDPRTWSGQDRLDAIEVGSTWLAASAQGTGVNMYSVVAQEWPQCRAALEARLSRTLGNPLTGA